MQFRETFADFKFLARDAVLLALLIGFTYLPTLGGWFSHDDFDLLRLAQNVWSLERPLDFVLASHNGLFTPLSNLLFWIEFQFFQFHYISFQISSLVIHWLNALLVAALAFALTRNTRLATLAGIIFAIAFPVQEPVSWIAAYVHLLSAFFYLAAILCFVLWTTSDKSGYLVASLVLLLIGILIKEDILTAPALLILLLLFGLREPLKRRQAVVGILSFAVIGLVYLLVIGFWHTSTLGSSVESGVYKIGWHGLVNYKYLVGLLVPPPDYSPFVSFVERLLPEAVLNIYAILAWALVIPLALLFLYSIIRGNPLQRFAVLLILIAYMPFSMTTVGIAPRYLYIPYAGFAILLADLITRLPSRYQTGVTVALGLFIILNIVTIWTWQLRMNQNGSVRASVIQTVAATYDDPRNLATSICIQNLPEKFQDLSYAIPVFVTKPPLPTVRLNKHCAAQDSLQFQFDGEKVVRQ